MWLFLLSGLMCRAINHFHSSCVNKLELVCDESFCDLSDVVRYVHALVVKVLLADIF